MSNAAKPSSEKRPYWHVALACPKCGATGMIPWDRLDRVLGCRRCSSWFRAERGALIEMTAPEADMQVAVRGSFGEWQTHRLRARDWTNSWLCRAGSLAARVLLWIIGLNWPGRIGLAGGLFAVSIGGVIMLTDSAAAPLPAPTPLPTDLTARATSLTEAWLDRDMPKMLQLTDKSFDRQLRNWSGKTPPPATDRSQRKVEALVIQREAHRATINVRVSLVSNGVSKSQLTQRQDWTDKAGTWYFVPPVSAKPAAASRPLR